MEDIEAEVEYLADAIEEISAELQDKEVPQQLLESHRGFNIQYKLFTGNSKSGSGENLSMLIAAVFSASQFFVQVQKLDDITEKSKALAKDSQSLANKILADTQNRPVRFSLNSTTKETAGDISSAPKKEIERQYQKLKDQVKSTSANASRLEEQVNGLTDKVSEEIKNVRSAYERGKTEVEAAKADFTELLSDSTGTLLNSDYRSSAERELRSANTMRNLSLAFMVATILVLTLTWIDHESAELTWQTATIRFLIALAFSIPAGYLAREAARHREHHHNYLQTSLNLKALTPYIASLPPEQQHALKAEMAKKLFVNTTMQPGNDLGLINVHELLLQIIKQAKDPTVK
ncbi:hypothetical protein [Lysobacter enzymogenes]|uniref:hypothetical protein n=1 Tax=Lysobacter enzymogenes TaxID=69 RepID=UPI00089866F8|nr:hypothetical protein [Lysobacter enzymogenes]SDX21013.1 hypothetical protein SAMN05421681_104227 [Lysobacter enzymogenes]